MSIAAELDKLEVASNADAVLPIWRDLKRPQSRRKPAGSRASREGRPGQVGRSVIIVGWADCDIIPDTLGADYG